MFSVTSDIAASVSFQGASPKPAKADHSPAQDSFATLVDSNATAVVNDRANSAAQDQPLPQRRDNDTSAASDDRSWRGETPSTGRSATTNSQDSGNAAGQSASADVNIDAETSKPAKSETVKTGIVKLATRATVSETVDTADIAAPADQAAATPVAESPAAAQTAIAVAIPVVIPSASVSVVPAPSSNTQAPLAIAAAAIAASSSDIGATTPTAPAPTAPAPEAANSTIIAAVAVPAIEAAATATAVATAATTTADPTSTAKVDVQAAVSEAADIPVNQPAAQTNANVQADPKLAAAVAVAIPAAPVAVKATSNTSTAPRPVEKTASTSIKTGAFDLSTGVAAPQAIDAGVATQAPAIDGKPKPADGALDALKPDTAGTVAASAAAASTSSHAHVSATAHVQTASPDQAALATNATQQPQLQATAPTAISATQLTVTAATLAPVPLTGLALQIAVTAQSGKSRFEIRLDPAELGRIDVRIDIDRHGQVTSHLTVEKPETLAMLRQDAPHLQRALDDAGLKTGDGGLQFSLRDQPSSGKNDGNETGRNSQRLIIGEEDIIPATVAGRTYGRTLGSSGGVDIRV